MKTRYILIGAALFSMGSCDKNASDDPAPVQEDRYTIIRDIPATDAIELTAEEQSGLDGKIDFEFDFFNEAVKAGLQDSDNGNIIVSPLSASLALTLMANSCSDNTTAEIVRMLGFENLDVLNTTANKVMRYLHCPSMIGGQLGIANSVWYSDRYSVSRDYADRIASVLYSECNKADFQDEATLDLINEWCSEKTNGMIPDFLDGWDPTRIAILLNTIYFAGLWDGRFDEDATRDMDFFGRDGKATVSMMHSENLHGYMESDLADVLCIPFKGTSSFFALLPKEGHTATELAETISYSDYHDFVTIYTPGNVNDFKLIVDFPKFKVSKALPLSPVFSKMGLSTMSDFSKMGIKEDVDLATLQKSELEIDEEGVKFAVVTGSCGGHDRPKTVEKRLTFDRPFLFFIMNDDARSVLLAGLVNNL